ncbi:hypothetical protein [Candidatus Nitrospira bockiana]
MFFMHGLELERVFGRADSFALLVAALTFLLWAGGAWLTWWTQERRRRPREGVSLEHRRAA